VAHERHAAFVEGRDEVHAAQQRALARAARAEQHRDFRGRDLQADPLQDGRLLPGAGIEALADVLQAQQRRVGRGQGRMDHGSGLSSMMVLNENFVVSAKVPSAVESRTVQVARI
jgi:hypothetical protein